MRCLWAVLVLMGMVSVTRAEDWQQFRGQRASGISTSKLKLPTNIATDKEVIWKSEVPPGISSPIVSGDRIYLTAVRGEQLLTLGLDRQSGKILWEQVAPHDKLEEIHRTGSYAQSTPATDGQIVLSFFGSSGLFAYDRNGKPLWNRRMGPFKNDFGAGSSPIIVENSVILVQDHDTDSFIASYNKQTGDENWKVDRTEFLRNYATPLVWEVSGKKEIVVAATLRVVGYDLDSGKEKWSVSGVSRIINMSPVIGPDNILYVASYSPGTDGENPYEAPSTDELFMNDADKSGTLEEKELPAGPLTRRFTQIDRNKDKSISREEYGFVRRALNDSRNVVLAIKPGGMGDITKTHVKWEFSKQIPYCPSPIVYDGVLFMVKDGGILISLDAETGKPIKIARLSFNGGYFASPVVGDGKLFLVSVEGDVCVVSAKGDWEELHSTKLEGDGHATPAIVDGRIYMRIGPHLYCFGLPDQTASRDP